MISLPCNDYSIILQTNQCEALYIINFEEIAYHQHEVLYIIKPQENPAPEGLMRYKCGEPHLMIYTTLRAAMICQACGLDKKEVTFGRQKLLLFWLRRWDLNLMFLTNSLPRICLRSPRGSVSPPDCLSLPLGRSLRSLPSSHSPSSRFATSGS